MVHDRQRHLQSGNASDPRFARVCAHLNLVDYWMTSGLWPDCADEVPYDLKAECENAVHELASTGRG